MPFKKIVLACLLSASLSTFPSYAAAGFVIHKIRVVGLQGVSLATVLSYLPVHEGQTLTASDTSAVINDLYQTGFFSDVSLARQGNDLIINVVERPTIGLIRISGNKIIKTKELKSALKDEDIAEGLGYSDAALANIKQALEQQYYALGRYNATVTTKATPESRNRVALDISIYEGQVATVKNITILGNTAFSQKKLLKNFKLTTPKLWSFFTKDDQYSHDKLEADLESLRAYYMDHGYLRFAIDSTAVSMTPNRRQVYIVIHVKEGDVYKIKGYQLSGNLLGKQRDVEKLITLKSGETFSRKDVVAVNDAIGHYYANNGYATVAVNVIPNIDDANKTVFLNFEVNPGPRVYVRHINFIGNTRTADYVLRREMRQAEGSIFSVANIDESKRRLNNLGYLDNITVDTKPVADKPNQVDLDYHVKEESSANASANFGYSDAYGFLYGANITENNFRGTGKTVSLGFSNSKYSQSYSYSYFNPYYTTSGISRGFSIYGQRVDPSAVSLASYALDTYGFSMNYRVPLSEYDYFNFGYGYEYTRVATSNPSVEIADFINEHGNRFNNTKITAGWLHNSYDRAIFPTKGFNQWLGLEAGVPLLRKSLDYYKLSYDAKWYHPLVKGFIINLDGDLGYGNGYGKMSDGLPFFENYYAGGIGSVRGFESNTLGPIDSLGNPIGGNILVNGSVNLILPSFISDRVRTSVFVDAGNVYQKRIQFSQLRYSTGVELDWWSPLGPLQFSLAKALNAHGPDQTQAFNFSVGTSF